jgi:hypothetical protein
MADLFRRAGLRHRRVHSLRHSAATEMVNRGASKKPRESFWGCPQVFDQAIAGILRQWEHSLSPRFRGANGDFAALPSDVFQSESRDFFGAKSQAREHQQHCAIPDLAVRFARASPP